MKIKDFKNIVFNIFVMLLVITIFFYLYNLINSFDFPSLWQRLLFFDITFAVLNFVLYFQEIFLIFSRFEPKIKKHLGRKTRYRLEYKNSKVTRRHFRIPKLNLRKITKIPDGCESFLNEFNKFPKKIEFKFILIVIGIICYGIFLIWIFPKVSFDEFMFFVLLLYIPVSLKLKLNPKYPIIIALVLLVVCAVILGQGFKDHADKIAIYTYYCLIVGVGLMFIDYLKNPIK